MNSLCYGRALPKGKIKSSQCLKTFCVKLLACSALDTHTIRNFFVCERPAQIFMPAPKYNAHKADLYSIIFGRINIPINCTLGYQILFQNRLHNFLTTYRRWWLPFTKTRNGESFCIVYDERVKKKVCFNSYAKPLTLSNSLNSLKYSKKIQEKKCLDQAFAYLS